MKRNYIELIAKTAEQLKNDFPEYADVINLYSNYDINTRARRRFGSCNYTKKQIQLCAYACDTVTLDDVIDTIKHEFAHAISKEVYKERGHGYIWKKVAKKIGANGKGCSKSIDDKVYTEYVLVFEDNGNIYHVDNLHRMTKRYKDAYHFNDGIVNDIYMRNHKETRGRLKVIYTQKYNVSNFLSFSENYKK